jgi:hypothetical protein
MGSSHYSDGVVVEDRGDIFGGELVGGVADEKTCLADSTVADDDTPVGERTVNDFMPGAHKTCRGGDDGRT